MFVGMKSQSADEVEDPGNVVDVLMYAWMHRVLRTT